MNIEQIAKETWSEVSKSSSVGQSIAVIFAKALLKKLAERIDMKPVACLDQRSFDWHVENNMQTTLLSVWRTSDWKSKLTLPGSIPLFLYTETQLLAAQQKAAGATWKAMTEGEDFFGASAAIAKATGGEA